MLQLMENLVFKMNKMKIISSKFLFGIYIFSNLIIFVVMGVSIYTMLVGSFKAGLILCIISLVFFLVNSSQYRLLYLKELKLFEVSIFKGVSVYPLKEFQSVESKEGMFLLKLNSGVTIPVFDSVWAKFPMMVQEQRRIDNIMKRLGLNE